MSRYDDRSRPSRYDRDRSPDYAYAGGSGVPPRVPSPGHTTFIPTPGESRARLEYEPQSPLQPPPPNYNSLQVPDSRVRPRSLPPPAGYRDGHSRHDRGRGRDRDRDDIDRDRSPVGKVKNFAETTFTDSNTGIGVGVLGALVGGLAAHEASEATSRHGGGRQTDAQRRNQLLSTVVGAAVGALGANAVEKRLEVGRDKTLVKQDKWEDKWGKRPDSRGNRDWEDDKRRQGRDRDVDPDARSWRNVEDWVYDDRDRDRDRSRRGRKSDDQYR